MARIDYDAAAADYARSRALSLEAMDGWREAVQRRLPSPDAGGALRIVDIGAGAGSFAYAFATWFDASVAAVEPSAGMLRSATSEYAHPRVAYVNADAHALPLLDATCDVAWLSTVIHHFADLDAAARETRRVLRDDGVALVRSAFPGRHDGITLFRRFPGASRVADSFPTLERTKEAFARAGFRYDANEAVPQVSAPSLRAFADRVRRRADTTLTHMPEDEYEAGLAQLQREADAEREPQPVIDYLDLVTFRA
jgi:ubiquinone/menaquinone biosynthesis C-methylase UbiE